MHALVIAQLLTRASVGALAFLLLAGAYGNRDFLTVLPFSLQIAIDVALATMLLYTAARFTQCTQHKKHFTRALVAATALYVATAQAMSLWYYVHELGIDYIAQSYGSFSWFLVTQGALDVGVPAVLLGLLYYSVHHYTAPN